MTGYGRSETLVGGRILIVEIKSLNHRNLEIGCRGGNGLGPLEISIKKKIAERVFRGRVEVILRFESDMEATGTNLLKVDLPLVREYYAILKQIRSDLELDDPITLDMVVSIKNGIYTAEPEYTDDETWIIIEEGIEKALAALMEMKEKEGSQLYKDFMTRIDVIRKYCESIASRAPQVVLEYRKRLLERIEELAADVEIDQARLAQETALMADKMDITEELVRLESHINHFAGLLESNEPVGRQLDFIAQEMHREINTVGSKSGDIEIARSVIDVKTELAKIREQVQNIE